MEESDTAASNSGSLPPVMIVPSPRGQKRGAPDEDEAAGDGAARGSPRRAAGDAAVDEEDDDESTEESVDEEEELDESESEDDAPPPAARELFDFMPVHPEAADADDATAGSSSSSTAGRRDQGPVDVTLRLDVGPLAAADTTLSLSLGSASAAAAQDDGHFQSHDDDEPLVSAATLGATASDDAEFNFYDVVELAGHGEDEGFFTAADGYVGVPAAADDVAAGREPGGLDLNQPIQSHGPGLAPAVDDDEAPAATGEKRHQYRAQFFDYCSFLPS